MSGLGCFSRRLLLTAAVLAVMAAVPGADGQSVSNERFDQIDLFGNQVPMQPDSQFGLYSALNVGAAAQFGYLNVVLNNGNGTGTPDTWAVQNLPIVPTALPGNEQPGPFNVYTSFDLGPLGIMPGQDLATLDGFKTITAAPLTSMPVAGTPYPSPTDVGSVNYDAEGKDNDAGPHNDPGTPTPNGSIAFNVSNVFRFTWHQNVPNVEQGSEECGPGSAANSLQWLKDEKGLPLTDSLTDRLNTLKDATHMMTDPVKGTKDLKFIQGKLQYQSETAASGLITKFQDDVFGGANVMFAGQTALAMGKKPTFDFIFNELAHGEDVEIGFTYLNKDGRPNGGHWVTAVGAIDVFGAVGVWFREDTMQGKAGGTGAIGFSWLTTRPDGFLSLANYGQGNNMVDIVVSESVPEPSSLAMAAVGAAGLVGYGRRRLAARAA